MKLISVGEIIWDIYPDGAVIGGAPLNFCAHLSHLGDTAYLFSAVSGTDRYGKGAMEELARHGVRTDLIQKNDRPTGSCLVTLDGYGVPCYEIAADCAHDHLTADEPTLDRIRSLGADVFSFNTLIQRNPDSRTALCRILAACSFPEIFCDINLRKDCYDRAAVLRCLENATCLKLSDSEAETLRRMELLSAGTLDAVPECLCRRYPNIRYAVLTLGADGSAVFDAAAGRLFRSGKPPRVQVVSTVGAGDCYGATFLHGIHAGLSVGDAIAAATERSNLVVSHKEAVPF